MSPEAPEARKEEHAGARRKLFGRRKGPKLSAHQERLLAELLPQLSLALEPGRDPHTYFSLSVDDVWLEVGFGAGEHLLWQAQHHPSVGIIGAEPYVSGVAKLLAKLAQTLPPSAFAALGTSPASAGEENEGAHFSSPACGGGGASVASDGGGQSLARIRLYSDDARNILDALPDASLGRVFILFPDPWPKTRHHKRRFIQTDTLDQLARVMKPGAELRFASDDAGYVDWTLERVTAHPAFVWTATRASDWQSRPADWPRTRYEAKELHGKPVFLRFMRVG